MNTLNTNDIPTLEAADVVVLGGGPAGIFAAVAAARSGARTVLIERYGFLGGAGTAGGASTFCGLYSAAEHGNERIVRGLMDELLEGLARFGGLNEPISVQDRIYSQSYDIAAYKCVADDLVLGAGVRLLVHCLAVGCTMEDARITSIIVESKAGRTAVTGRIFIDCSGDGNLAAWSGAPFEKGDASGNLQTASMLFRIAGVDDERASQSARSLRTYMEEAKASGKFDLPRLSGVLRLQVHAGEWRANMTNITRDGRPLDCTELDDLVYGEIEGRRQVRLYAQFLRECVPGFEDSYVVDLPTEVATRETRRITGRYQLTADDIVSGVSFDDCVGVNAWPVELHVDGMIEWRFVEGRAYYDMPYRALVSVGPRNLLFAGRCLSAERSAQAAARTSGACFVMGQAAGTAAAIACGTDVDVADVDAGSLRSRLTANNVFLG